MNYPHSYRIDQLLGGDSNVEGESGAGREGEGFDRRKNGTGIVHILKFHGLHKSIHPVLWLEAHRLGITQYGRFSTWQDLIPECDVR